MGDRKLGKNFTKSHVLGNDFFSLSFLKDLGRSTTATKKVRKKEEREYLNKNKSISVFRRLKKNSQIFEHSSKFRDQGKAYDLSMIKAITELLAVTADSESFGFFPLPSVPGPEEDCLHLSYA